MQEEPAVRLGDRPARLRFGIFELDVPAGELRRDGRPVRLQPQPFKVLTYLAANPGRVITRDELREHVWGREIFVDFERGLNFCVLQIRTALGDDAQNPRFVQTLPRRGYRFLAPVAAAEAGEVETPRETRVATAGAEALRGDVPAARTGPRLARWAVWIVAAALLALFAVVLRPNRPRPQTAPRAMLAVLPFRDLSAVPQPHFVDGLTEELIARLGSLNPSALGVIARTSVLRFASGTESVRKIGRELSVTHVLEGSVRREGGRLRIAAQLIRVDDETHIFSETYDRDEGAAIPVQDEVARTVVGAISRRLLPMPQAASPKHPSPEAFDAYLKGRYWANKGTAADLVQALEFFQESIRLNGTDARVYAAVAEAEILLRMRDARPAREAFPKAEHAARRAIQLSPGLAEGHVSLGAVALWYHWDPDEAERELTEALALNPSLGAAHHDLAWVHMAKGRPDAALTAIRRAQELDPLSPRARVDVGWVLLRARRSADALAECRRTLELEPGFSQAEACVAEALTQLGRHQEAFDWTTRVLVKGEAGPEQFAAIAEAGRKEPKDGLREARRVQLERKLRRLAEGKAGHYGVAVDQVALGLPEDALRSLEKAKEEREPMMVLLGSDDAFGTLRDRGDFREILKGTRKH